MYIMMHVVHGVYIYKCDFTILECFSQNTLCTLVRTPNTLVYASLSNRLLCVLSSSYSCFVWILRCDFMFGFQSNCNLFQEVVKDKGASKFKFNYYKHLMVDLSCL